MPRVPDRDIRRSDNMRRRYANDMYRIEATQSGDDIDYFKTFREAMAALKRYEKEDMRNGCYVPGFYTIARFTDNWYQPYYDSKHGYHMNFGPRDKPRKKKRIPAPFGL